MRAYQFIKEESFGTREKRAGRPGSRPARGHEPQERYKLDHNDPRVKELKKHGAEYLDHIHSDDELDQVHKALIKEGTLHACPNCGGPMVEHGPTSKKLCLSTVSDKDLGASALASCKSQGLRARDGKKSHLIGHGKSKVRITVGGKKIRGKAHGGPLPDYGTRKSQK
jgi:hypothetical protein